MWVRDESAARVITKAWSKGHTSPSFPHLMTKLKNTKIALKIWNRQIFGHIPIKIMELKQYIEELQSNLPTDVNFELESKTQWELDEILLRECILWKEKAKAQWLQENGVNTCFFHLTIVIHRSKNHIQYILANDNLKIEDYDQIANLFIEYFFNLFTSVNPVCSPDCQGLFQASITESMNNSLIVVLSIMEVHKTVLCMASNKSPSPDDMSPVFYKAY